MVIRFMQVSYNKTVNRVHVVLFVIDRVSVLFVLQKFEHILFAGRCAHMASGSGGGLVGRADAPILLRDPVAKIG